MSTPKTGEALREEIEATLRTAHERRVDLDALADNVEAKLQARDTAMAERWQLQRDVDDGAIGIDGRRHPRPSRKLRLTRRQRTEALLASMVMVIIFAIGAIVWGLVELDQYGSIPYGLRASPIQIWGVIFVASTISAIAVIGLAIKGAE